LWRKREDSGGWSIYIWGFVIPKPLYIDISKFSGLYPISNCLSSTYISHNMDKYISYIEI
jgi:hypothetical protein